MKISGNDIIYLVSSLNVELEFLYRMLKANKLYLNAQYTFFLVFYRARIKYNDLSIRIDKSTLIRSTNWCEHIAHVKNIVSKGIGILYKVRQFLDKKSLYTLYNSYIYPYLI